MNKRRLLVNFLSPATYPYVEDINNYDEAIRTLKNLYVKPKNKIFSRHVLATRKQQPGESIKEFLQSLKILSKDCSLEAVTAEQYREDLIQNAFNNGLSSSVIQQRSLEKDELNLQQTYELAFSLNRAQQQSSAYASLAASVPKETASAPTQEELLQYLSALLQALLHKNAISVERSIIVVPNALLALPNAFCAAKRVTLLKCASPKTQVLKGDVSQLRFHLLT